MVLIIYETMKFVLPLIFLIGWVANVTEHSMTTDVGARRFTLPCRVEGPVNDNNEQNVEWYRDAVRLTAGIDVYRDRSRLKVDHQGLTEWNLIINNIQHNDAALYTCKVNSVDIVRVQLLIQTPPEIDELGSTPRLFNVTELSSPTLTCKANGQPPPNITWYRKPQHVFEESTLGEEIGVTGSILKIHNITRYAGDVYICEAKNIIGAKTYEINVMVTFAPEVILLERQIEVTPHQKDPVVMTCVGQAAPLNDVYWWKDIGDNGPVRIESNWKYLVESQTEPGYPMRIVTLVIRRWEDSDFDSFFTCRVEGKTADGNGTMVEDTVNLIRYQS